MEKSNQTDDRNVSSTELEFGNINKTVYLTWSFCDNSFVIVHSRGKLLIVNFVIYLNIVIQLIYLKFNLFNLMIRFEICSSLNIPRQTELNLFVLVNQSKNYSNICKLINSSTYEKNLIFASNLI